MGTYVTLFNFTDQGVKNIKAVPQRIEAVTKQLESMGGKVIAVYSVMGQYDMVSVYEAPTDEVAITSLLGIGMAGNSRTTTLKAFTREEFASIVSKLT